MSKLTDMTDVQSESFGRLSVNVAALFIVGEIAGSGVLALPKAVDNSGWIGIVLMVLCAVFSAYTGDILGKAWSIIQERFPEYRGHVRNPYPLIGQIAYGRFGRYLVSFSINFTLFGVATVFLLLASENIESLIGHVHDISFCYWLMIVTAVLLPLSWLGTPSDFWGIAAGAVAATSVACVILFAALIKDKPEHPVLRHTTPGFVSFFTAFGTICFAFGGHPAFPTFQADMRNPKHFGKAVLLAYLIVLAMYLPVSVTSYFIFGRDVQDNVLSGLTDGPLKYIVQILITLHLMFGYIIVINPVSQEVEEIAKIPKHFTWKRCVSRTVMVALILFVAETIPHFGAILSLIGGSTTTLLAYVCPSLFYLKLCSMRSNPQNGDLWETIPIPLHTKVLNYEIIFVGVVAGVASTYSAISGMASPDTFTLPCFVNITAANG